jgi:hypothetical protein
MCWAQGLLHMVLREVTAVLLDDDRCRKEAVYR